MSLNLKPELLHAGPNQRNTLFEIAVDQNMALRSGNQIARKPFATDVIEVVRDFEWRKWFSPIICLRVQSAGTADACRKSGY